MNDRERIMQRLRDAGLLVEPDAIENPELPANATELAALLPVELPAGAKTWAELLREDKPKQN